MISGAEEAAAPASGKIERGISPRALGITGAYNPYDPDEIIVDVVVKRPDGSERVFPCFWHVPCEPFHVRGISENGKQETEWERFKETGAGEWRFRVCPAQAGAYGYIYRVTTAAKTWSVPGSEFRVDARRGAGGARPVMSPIVVRKGSRYFWHRDGTPFVPVGQNLGWPEEPGSKIYRQWLAAMGRQGANCGRLWLVHYMGGTSLEWSPTNVNAGYRGAGQYSQESAARVDAILDAAAEHGVYMMLSFFSFGDTNWDWEKNPYCRKAGGWLDSPAEFFTDARTRKAVRNVLRYSVARYGWSPNLWAWELWNEVETSKGYEEKAVADWHAEMAGYLKTLDGHEHLVTTSYRFTPPDTSCLAYGLDSIDFVQVHTYWPKLLEIFPKEIRAVQSFNKPVLVGEFGLWVSPDYFDADPIGLHVHDGLWTALFSGAAGAGMTWWWERYVHPRNLYHHFAGIARFANGESFDGVRPCASSIRISAPAAPVDYFSLALKNEEAGTVWAWVGTSRRVEFTEPGSAEKVKSYSCKMDGAPLELFVEGALEGKYTVLLYDTFDGVPIAVSETTGGAKGLRISIPAFRHDIAVKCLRADPKRAASEIHTRTPIHDGVK